MRLERLGLEEKTVLAALLHDVGKVIRRAEGREENHARLTWEFLCGIDEELAEIAYGHHRGKKLNTLKDVKGGLKKYAEVVCEADSVSAGLERERISDDVARNVEGLDEWKRRGESKRPMLNILSTVDVGKGESRASWFPVRELTLKPFYLKAKDIDEAGADYGFWRKFRKEIEAVLKSGVGFNKLLFTLTNLLKRYLFFVPADTFVPKEAEVTIPIPDTSLYEHLRLTSIFAYAMLKNRKKFVLVRGDISGIQDFIARITHKKALRFLKGRSFYLELLNLAAAFRICRDLGIPPTQILSATAGNFTIIAPLADDYEEKLREAVREINYELIDLGLYVAVAWSEVSYEEARKSFNKVMDEVTRRVEERKAKRYQEFMNERDYDRIFGEHEPRSGLKECDVCKAEVAEEELESLSPEEEGEAVKVCKSCYEMHNLSEKLIEVGKLIEELRKAGGRAAFYIGVYEGRAGDVSVAGIGFKVDALARELSDADYVFKINDTDFLEGELLGKAGCGFRFMNVYVSETGVDKLVEVEESGGVRPRGARYIGVLKMDGDDMGKVFSSGVVEWWRKRGMKNEKEVKMTPSRYATLSSLIELFFGYCVEKICEEGCFFTGEKFAEERKIYVVFSGGDDLFVLGLWSQVVDLALKIQEEYRMFTGNPNLTISGSLYVTIKKFPVYKSYREVLSSLEAAKERFKPEKSAISLFGEEISFGDVSIARRVKDIISGRVERGELPRSIIHALLGSLGGEARYRRRWAAKYVIARYHERYGGLEELDGIVDEAFKNNKFEPLIVGLRWSELLTREVRA